MRGDARSRKQNGKPELPIQWIPQGGESRALIWIFVHGRCHWPKPELFENQTDLSPAAKFRLTERRFCRCLKVRVMPMRSCESIRSMQPESDSLIIYYQPEVEVIPRCSRNCCGNTSESSAITPRCQSELHALAR